MVLDLSNPGPSTVDTVTLFGCAGPRSIHLLELSAFRVSAGWSCCLLLMLIYHWLLSVPAGGQGGSLRSGRGPGGCASPQQRTAAFGSFLGAHSARKQEEPSKGQAALQGSKAVQPLRAPAATTLAPRMHTPGLGFSPLVLPHRGIEEGRRFPGPEPVTRTRAELAPWAEEAGS